MKRATAGRPAPPDERDRGRVAPPARESEARPAGADGPPTVPTDAHPGPGPAWPGFDRRSFMRWPVFWRARMVEPEQGKWRECLVLDFSPGGAKIRSSRPPAVGSAVALELSPSVRFKGRVAWAEGGVMGIEFEPGSEGTVQLLDDAMAESAAESEPGAALKAAAPPRARRRRDREP